jgi:RNA polymerase sigma-70 factor (ECF subfamily)
LEAVNYTNLHQDVIDRCKAGDRSAQFTLYKLYAKAMLNSAYRIVKNTAGAEDVVQESFLRAFKNIHLYKGESSFGSWLKRIVINQALSSLRREKVVWFSVEDKYDSLQEILVENEEAEWNYQASLVKAKIEQLPEGYRIILQLYLLEGFDHGEIAEYLGISESTSKTQYSRAKQKLRMMLESKTTHTG